MDLFSFEVIYGMIPVKTTKRPSNLIKRTFIWVQVSVGTEYQMIPCINRRGSGKLVGVLNRPFQPKIKESLSVIFNIKISWLSRLSNHFLPSTSNKFNQFMSSIFDCYLLNTTERGHVILLSSPSQVTGDLCHKA